MHYSVSHHAGSSASSKLPICNCTLMLVCIHAVAVVTRAISTCCGPMLWCLACRILMSIPTVASPVATGQGCSHSVLAVHDILSTGYMDLALIHDSGLTVLPRCLAQSHAFPVKLLIAIVVPHCSADLLHIQGLHLGIVLVQPALSLAQLMVKMLPRIPESTSNPYLQEHLIRAALHFISKVDKQPGENGVGIIQGTVKAVIPMLPLWASPESHPEDLGYSDIGLRPLEPKLMQASALALIMPVVEVHQLFQSNPALESCVEWFVNSTQRCMATSHELRPDDRGVTCNVYMAPYLKLISEIELLCLFSMFARNISCGCWLAQLSQNSWPARCVATISHRCFA